MSEHRSYRPYHSAFAGWSNCCDTIPGGGYVVGGASEDTTGFDEVYLMRFDANGDTLWTKVFGDPNGNQFWIGQQVKRTADGGFVIVGFTEQGNWDGFAIKTDSDGNEQWRSTYYWSSAFSDGLASVALGAQGDLFMSGSRFLADGTGDNWLQRTDSAGTLRWRVSWGGAYSEGSCNVSVGSDGNVFAFSGRGYTPSYTAMRAYLAKIDSADGAIIWEKDYSPSKPFTQFATGRETSSGDIIAAGITYEQPGPSIGKGLMALTSSTGDSLWLYKYFYQDSILVDGTGRFHDVLPTADGGFIAAGATYFSASGNNPAGISQDTWVVKVDGNGCIIPGCNNVGITEQATNLLDAFSIYPNPAHGSATVQLSLPQSVAGALELMLVAMDGRVVQRERLAGNGAHVLDLSQLGAGVYYAHIAQGGKWLTGGKLVVE
ncbi:MAG: T9SS type A sorting domain-containing protein [Flavobacteriales bacterium]|nr:T9SS type A sorting domain-containing protein [Flavobacteriales bacterium]